MKVRIGEKDVEVQEDSIDGGLAMTLRYGTPSLLQGWINRKARKCIIGDCECAVCNIAFFMEYSKSEVAV